MKTLYTAHATALGGRDGHVKSSDGVVDLDVRMPKELGGTGGLYTNPEQLFAAGYAACFDSALKHVARLKKVDLKSSAVTAHVSIGALESGGFGLAVELEVRVGGLPQTEAQSLAEAAHAVCPYSNATRNNIPVSLQVKAEA